MVSFVEGLRDVALIRPGQSLILQITEWSREHPGYAVRLVSARQLQIVAPAFGAAAFSVVDATAEPDRAVELLALGVETAGREKVGLYTEIIHGELETLVRTLGVPFWLGPMRIDEWESALKVLVPAAAT